MDVLNHVTVQNSSLISTKTPVDQVITEAIKNSTEAINNGSQNPSETNSVESRQEKYRRSERPVGNKRSLEQSKQVAVLNRGAMAVEKLAESSRKKARVTEGMLEVEGQKRLVDIFSMPGTDPETMARFRELAQNKELKRLEREMTAENDIQETNSLRENSDTATTNFNNNDVEQTQNQNNVMDVGTLID